MHAYVEPWAATYLWPFATFFAVSDMMLDLPLPLLCEAVDLFVIARWLMWLMVGHVILQNSNEENEEKKIDR